MACRSPRESRPSPPAQPPAPPGPRPQHEPALPSSMRPNRQTAPAGPVPLPMQPPCTIPSIPPTITLPRSTNSPPCLLPSTNSTLAISETLIPPATDMEGRGVLGCDSLHATELRLGLPGVDVTTAASKPNKRALADDSDLKIRSSSKAQVVGWPPVRPSYRRNNIQAKRSEAAEVASFGILVKVSMDGAPYLRKIDLKVYNGYKELRDALEDMFKGFSLSLECGSSDGETCSGTDYAIAYEDKDGDWMLAGDVPWKMFISSCRRLRIMKGSETRGLASGP